MRGGCGRAVRSSPASALSECSRTDIDPPDETTCRVASQEAVSLVAEAVEAHTANAVPLTVRAVAGSSSSVPVPPGTPNHASFDKTPWAGMLI